MPHFLWKAVLGQNPKIEVTKVESDKLISSWSAIASIVEIEEEWDCLIQNYLDFEMELLRAAMHSMVVRETSYSERHDQRLAFSRRLSNLLHSCRSYIDHAPHYLSKVGNSDLKRKFDELRTNKYDAHFGYRFLDAMRNHAQHRGVPLHGSTYNAKWMTDEYGNEMSWLQYTVAAYVNIDKIINDKKIKSSIRSEVKDEKKVDAAKLVREYIEALGGIQDEMRESWQESLLDWKAAIRAAIQKYANVNDGNVTALVVGEFDDDEKLLSEVPLFEDLLQRQELLARRNGSLINLRRRYVTNKIYQQEH